VRVLVSAPGLVREQAWVLVSAPGLVRVSVPAWAPAPVECRQLAQVRAP
jgi:hypothetical protein